MGQWLDVTMRCKKRLRGYGCHIYMTWTRQKKIVGTWDNERNKFHKINKKYHKKIFIFFLNFTNCNNHDLDVELVKGFSALC